MLSIKKDKKNKYTLNKEYTNELASIYYTQFDALYSYGKRFTSDNFLIEDAIQNVFVNLMLDDKYKKIDNIRNYVLVSFRNELIRLINKSRKHDLLDQVNEFEFTSEYSENENFENEELKILRSIISNYLLKSTTSRQQEIIYLKYDLGLTYEEISKILKITIESCRTLAYRTIKKMASDPELLKKLKALKTLSQ
jgi:RNA polymerase sigma factor (sigma-70 family)